MQWTGKRIFTIVMAVGTVITTYQLLSKPRPVATPQSAEAARANVQSFDQKLEQLQAPRTDGSAPAESLSTFTSIPEAALASWSGLSCTSLCEGDEGQEVKTYALCAKWIAGRFYYV